MYLTKYLTFYGRDIYISIFYFIFVAFYLESDKDKGFGLLSLFTYKLLEFCIS